MDRDKLLGRLNELERDLDLLRDEIEPAQGIRRFIRPLKRLGVFITQYWILFSVLVGIITALYIQYRFRIDYFDEYRSAATTRDLSEFYRRLGDRMMAYTEWDAAEDAYNASLELDPNNTDATYGIVKAKVFQPLEGERFFVPQVVSIRLDHLLSNFPEDHQVLFLKGNYFLSIRDIENAKVWLQCAIDQQNGKKQECTKDQQLVKNSKDKNEKVKDEDKKFIGSYLSLGIAEQESGNLDEARQQFEKVLELDSKDNFVARNNLGFLYLLNLEFGKSIWSLDRAYKLSPNLLTLINLGDAYLFSGKFSEALELHTSALEWLNTPGIENERDIKQQWIYNFMPRQPGDRETIQKYVPVSSLSQKQAILHYRLSFDNALKENFVSADQEFKSAQGLDPSHQFNTFFIYRIESMKNLLKMDDAARRWLETQQNTLILQLPPG